MASLKNKLATAKEQVREAYRNGATLRQISDVHGVSPGTVRNTLIEMGERLRPRGRKPADPVFETEPLRVEDLDGADTEEFTDNVDGDE